MWVRREARRAGLCACTPNTLVEALLPQSRDERASGKESDAENAMQTILPEFTGRVDRLRL